eukprot:4651426-Pleurochrysis_carterae.AAC.1
MAVERQQHRSRQERAGRDLGKSRWTKTRAAPDWIRRERTESLRCVAPRAREGWNWTLRVPPQGCIHARPEPTSQAVCEQRTRGCAEAHAGPEPIPVCGRNPHGTGKSHGSRQTPGRTTVMSLLIMMLLIQEVGTAKPRNRGRKREISEAEARNWEEP